MSKLPKAHIIGTAGVTVSAGTSSQPGAAQAEQPTPHGASRLASGPDLPGRRAAAPSSGARVLVPLLLVGGGASWHPEWPSPPEVTPPTGRPETSPQTS